MRFDVRFIVFGFVFAMLAWLSYAATSGIDIPRAVDSFQVKTYLLSIFILLAAVLLILAWWVLYLPSPARWYLACARCCLFTFLGSCAAIFGGFCLKYFDASVQSIGRVYGVFDDGGYERVAVLIVSVVFLDIFSRKYAQYR